jgi:hypothetical protein
MGVLEQMLACGGELETARMALKKLGLKLMLLQGQAPTGRRHGNEAGLGSTGEVAQVGGFYKQHQGVNVGQHEINSSAKPGFSLLARQYYRRPSR